MTTPGPPQPAWDGTGVDPWLPARLSVQATVAASERALYADVWAELSRWIVGVSRRVLASVAPDPHAIHAAAPAWRSAAARIAAGPVRDIIAAAYGPLLGGGYRFDQRPAVVEHLATVTNRLSDTPDQVFDLVAAEVAKGSQSGESIPEIAARVEQTLDATATPRWRNRAVTIARTETLSALNAGRDDAFAAVAEELDDGEIVFERMWLATADARTRPSHRAAEGQRSPVGGTFTVGDASLRRPGDPLGPPSEVVCCRCTTLLVEAGETVDLSNRQFRNYQ